jgi:hypothetical protein
MSCSVMLTGMAFRFVGSLTTTALARKVSELGADRTGRAGIVVRPL